MRILTATLLMLSCSLLHAQNDPYLDYWWFNTSGHTINGILTDVEHVYYDNDYVYVQSSGVPSYVVFGATVNDPSDRNYTYKIPRNPQPNTGVAIEPMGGGTGVQLDGSQVFTPGDARSWQNQGIWNQLAYFFEGQDFDTTGGHSTPTNEYHHHVAPTNYYDADSSKHSALIGFAFDGYPIYGPFGYADANDTSSDITRMKTSYRTRTMASRTTLPDGTVSAGPPINTTYPLGAYIEDYEYVAALGDLDEHNGRNCKTPEFPNGTYAYFISVDGGLNPVYPYILGPTLYGIIPNGVFGPTGNQFTIPGGAVEYVPDTNSTGISQDVFLESSIALYPNPTNSRLQVQLDKPMHLVLTVFNSVGQAVMQEAMDGTNAQLDISSFATGIYTIQCKEVQSGALRSIRVSKL